MAKKKEEGWCCWGGKKGFPTFAVIVLVLATLWLLESLNILTVKVPWFPVIMILIALGWIIDHYRKK